MRSFFHCHLFRFIWFTKPSIRSFHRGHQLWAAMTSADFEAINRCDRPLPKNFNFAGDVLDQWSQKEKVWNNGMSLDSSHALGSICQFQFKSFTHLAFLCFLITLLSPRDLRSSTPRGILKALFLPNPSPYLWLLPELCAFFSFLSVSQTATLWVWDAHRLIPKCSTLILVLWI